VIASVSQQLGGMTRVGVVGVTRTLGGVSSGSLPSLPAGYAFWVDENGNYAVDENGNYIVFKVD
jgi:hypothetical protein